ncbi:O-methyltransferase [Timonella senegalensis]|uniref:O-methyltransferase n=1 Tax=Timonella senegalensis TaxID=1465825 RepID=UPI000592B410|nr:O-methyltransferase [Timonella senegalensis]
MSEKAQNWTYSELFVAESDAIASARERAGQLGCPSVSPGTGAALRQLAAISGARSVVEIGTGTGVSSMWLLEGMDAEGVLTTIDSEREFHKAAKAEFANAGIKSTRTRTITGHALEVLPRLADGAYDLIFVGTEAIDYPSFITQALRLLRTGGLLILDNALWYGKVADPANREEVPSLLREIGRSLLEDSAWIVSLQPTGNGLLLATKR